GEIGGQGLRLPAWPHARMEAAFRRGGSQGYGHASDDRISLVAFLPAGVAHVLLQGSLRAHLARQGIIHAAHLALSTPLQSHSERRQGPRISETEGPS